MRGEDGGYDTLFRMRLWGVHATLYAESDGQPTKKLGATQPGFKYKAVRGCLLSHLCAHVGVPYFIDLGWLILGNRVDTCI